MKTLGYRKGQALVSVYIVLLMMLAVLQSAYGLTITVTNSSHSGAGSLREAIETVNAGSDATNSILFDISGTPPYIIDLTNGLPSITKPVLIDGYSEPDYDGVPVIQIIGTNAGYVSGIFFISGAAGSHVRGLDIRHFGFAGISLSADECTAEGNYLMHSRYGIYVAGVQSNVIGGTASGAGNVISSNSYHGIFLGSSSTEHTIIQGNLIGTDPTGMQAMGNGQSGISVSSGKNNLIGGSTAEERNIVSGNILNGILLHSQNQEAGHNIVQGNYVGLTADGLSRLPNSSGSGVSAGIQIYSTGNTIGGSNPGEENVVSGNRNQGIVLDSTNATDNLIIGNIIGLNAYGTAIVSNGSSGIEIIFAASNMVGGTATGMGNTICGNGGDGVFVLHTPAENNAILGNSIYGNADLGIDLLHIAEQPFPILLSATNNGVSTTVEGIVSGTTGVYRLEFFANPTCDDSGYGEGKTFLGFAGITIALGSNQSAFATSLPYPLSSNHVITATATDPENNTSEFSACQAVELLDSDGDGIPNQWELDHGLSPFISNDGIDTDGDDIYDVYEYFSDTEPTNALDNLHITGVSFTPDPDISFPSSAKRFYSLSRLAGTLSAATWYPITGVTPGNGTTNTLTDTMSTADSNGFYRVIAEIP